VFRKILPHIKHPYVVGIVIVVWVGTMSLYNIDRDLPITAMVVLNSLLTILVTKHAMS
jgi:hypothetical protein